MKKIIISVVALASVCAVMAQETYENAKIATEDLNGTARYVGMGGAMEALGADISTISSNPAGIGLFIRLRRKEAHLKTLLEQPGSLPPDAVRRHARGFPADRFGRKAGRPDHRGICQGHRSVLRPVDRDDGRADRRDVRAAERTPAARLPPVRPYQLVQ